MINLHAQGKLRFTLDTKCGLLKRPALDARSFRSGQCFVHLVDIARRYCHGQRSVDFTQRHKQTLRINDCRLKVQPKRSCLCKCSFNVLENAGFHSDTQLLIEDSQCGFTLDSADVRFALSAQRAFLCALNGFLKLCQISLTVVRVQFFAKLAHTAEDRTGLLENRIAFCAAEFNTLLNQDLQLVGIASFDRFNELLSRTTD
mmetsp:Transcript_6207/g.11771  ORF Transcript_6207/g.11771 Transcript_6207/m.11771 type:complete len:202 (-) Transcript_6207:4361-4966(-)